VFRRKFGSGNLRAKRISLELLLYIIATIAALKCTVVACKTQTNKVVTQYQITEMILRSRWKTTASKVRERHSILLLGNVDSLGDRTADKDGECP